MSLTKMVRAILTPLIAAVALAAPSPAHADFYDGHRGPNLFQLDQRLALGEDSAPNYTILPKAFVDDDNNGHGIFVVTPLNYTPSHTSNAGAGLGGFYKLGSASLLGVVPVVYSSEGDTTNINPTLYTSFVNGNLLLDPRLSYLASIAGDTTAHRLNFGGTIGYAIDDVILGLDAEVSLDPTEVSFAKVKDTLRYQGILRVDLDAAHRHWLQAYLGKDVIGFGFRANFGE